MVRHCRIYRTKPPLHHMVWCVSGIWEERHKNGSDIVHTSCAHHRLPHSKQALDGDDKIQAASVRPSSIRIRYKQRHHGARGWHRPDYRDYQLDWQPTRDHYMWKLSWAPCPKIFSQGVYFVLTCSNIDHLFGKILVFLWQPQKWLCINKLHGGSHLRYARMAKSMNIVNQWPNNIVINLLENYKELYVAMEIIQISHHITREMGFRYKRNLTKFCWFRMRVRNSWFRITIERFILVQCWFHVQVTLVVKKWYLWMKSTPHIPGLTIYTPRARPPSLVEAQGLSHLPTNLG